MSEKKGLHPAVFLDRDGTITPEIGYVLDPGKLTLLPGAADAVKRLRNAGFKVIVITNQSAVARGMMHIETLEAVNRKLMYLLRDEGTGLDGLYYCPHHPTEGNGEFTRVCDCRKPAPGMVLQAAEEHSVDLSRSFIVGDKITDISMASGLGARGILVKTGYGGNEPGASAQSDSSSFKPDHIAENISAAADWIMLQSR